MSFQDSVNDILELKDKNFIPDWDNLKIERALEPSDIIWTNYGYEKFEKILTRTFTTVITFVIMGVAYLIIVIIKNY